MHRINVLHLDQFGSGEKEAKGFYYNSLRQHLITSHQHIEKPHRHNFYVTVFFTKGSGAHEIDFQNYSVEPGAIFFLNPGQVHSWHLSEDTDGYIFFHNAEFYDLHFVKNKVKDFVFFNSIQSSRKLSLNKLQTKEFSSKFLEIAEYFAKDSSLKYDYILACISQIYIKSQQLFDNQQSLNFEGQVSVYQQHYEDFVKLVDEHFLTQKSASSYAEMLSITPKHLNRITQSMVKKTATDIISDRVILEAQRMLFYLDDSFNEIAFRLGYDDYAYFVRVFKKLTDTTPTQFLKKYK